MGRSVAISECIGKLVLGQAALYGGGEPMVLMPKRAEQFDGASKGKRINTAIVVDSQEGRICLTKIDFDPRIAHPARRELAIKLVRSKKRVLATRELVGWEGSNSYGGMANGWLSEEQLPRLRKVITLRQRRRGGRFALNATSPRRRNAAKSVYRDLRSGSFEVKLPQLAENGPSRGYF